MIKKILQEAKEEVEKLWYEVYYIWLYGSQNYNLDTEKSDYDFKCIILPSLEDLAYNTKPISKVIDFWDWQIDIKDIRTYIDSAVKVNINFIEILSTDYYIGWEEIRAFFKHLLDEMPMQYLKACYGMIRDKFHALTQPYPSKAYEIETFWYDPKQLMHIKRLLMLMYRYLDWDYSFKHDEFEREYLLNIKSWRIPLEDAQILADQWIEEASKLLIEREEIYNTKNEIIKWSRDLIINHIREWKN